MNKQRLLIMVLAVVMMAGTASPAASSNVDFGVNINIGAPPVVEEPPQFIFPSSLGFYVAIGLPYDMFYLGNTYYAYRGNHWYYAPRYSGPWRQTYYRRLPAQLREHRLGQIREYREHEYRVYDRDRDHYRGQYFRPERERREGYGDRGEGHGDRGEGHGREFRR